MSVWYLILSWSSDPANTYTPSPPSLSTTLPCHRSRHSLCAVACAALAWHILVWIFNGFAVKLMSQRRSKVKQSHVVVGAGFAQFALAQQEQDVAWGEGGARGVCSLLACCEDRHIVGGLRLERRFVSAWQTINFAAPAWASASAAPCDVFNCTLH